MSLSLGQWNDGSGLPGGTARRATGVHYTGGNA